jgi:hypothetical protein
MPARAASLMAKQWEIRGLFGNEYALGQAVEGLKRLKGLEFKVLDRRNLSVTFAKRDSETEQMVKRTFEINHGFVESEGPLGEYDAKKEAVRLKKLKELEEKSRRSSH